MYCKYFKDGVWVLGWLDRLGVRWTGFGPVSLLPDVDFCSFGGLEPKKIIFCVKPTILVHVG